MTRSSANRGWALSSFESVARCAPNPRQGQIGPPPVSVFEKATGEDWCRSVGVDDTTTCSDRCGGYPDRSSEANAVRRRPGRWAVWSSRTPKRTKRRHRSCWEDGGLVSFAGGTRTSNTRIQHPGLWRRSTEWAPRTWSCTRKPVILLRLVLASVMSIMERYKIWRLARWSMSMQAWDTRIQHIKLKMDQSRYLLHGHRHRYEPYTWTGRCR